MGLRIRIKVKHILLIIVTVFFSIYFMLPNALFIYARAMESSDIETSKSYYRMYANLFPGSGRGAEALYKIAEKIVPSDMHDYRYNFYTGHRGGGETVTADILLNAADYYKEILDKYRDSEYYVRSYGSLIRLYVAAGMFDEGLKLIDQGLSSDNADIRFISSKYSMLYQLISGEYDGVLKTGSMHVDAAKADTDIYMLMGDAYMYQKLFDEAISCYDKALTYERNSNTQYEMYYDGNASPCDRKTLVNKMKTKYTGQGSIHGRVTINGRPAPYVYIYLKDEKDGDLNSIGDEKQCIAGMTDFDGEYSISSLAKGNYVLGIGVSSPCIENAVFQTPEHGYFHHDGIEDMEYSFSFNPPMKLIKPEGNITPDNGKVELEWQRVEGAAYYLIRLINFEDPVSMEGSYSAFSPFEKIFDNKFTMDINKVNIGLQSILIGDDGRMNPQAYIGTFYPGSLVPLYIEAYDKSGTRLTSTIPMKVKASNMAAISIPDTELTEGDRLILEKKPEEGADYFEKVLLENPDDYHALSVLLKIYLLGTRNMYDSNGKSNTEGVDRERAGEIARRLYQMTGDSSYLKVLQRQRFTDAENYSEDLRVYMEMPEEELDADDYIRIAQLNLYLENYSEADGYYEKIYHIYKDTNYYDLAPVLLKLYYGDYEGSIRFADILDLRLYKVDKDMFLSDLNKLKLTDKGTQEYSMFKDAISILLSPRDDDLKERFTEIYNGIKTPELSSILRQAGNYYYLFENY